MPIAIVKGIFWIGSLLAGSLFVNQASNAVETVGNELEDTATKTAPNLVMVGAALLGLYVAFKVIGKGKI